eukprot:TRINITY_DN2402_c0_g1_i10.p1 TRINITY_DN2402_c0_g1~~TRINITY_DN2402_c0_g1_i10.p1  ORF type:complete len:1143 (+),score=188.57 TRINITY_DN2402_c0_g1_i10:244-3672(+)
MPETVGGFPVTELNRLDSSQTADQLLDTPQSESTTDLPDQRSNIHLSLDASHPSEPNPHRSDPGENSEKTGGWFSHRRESANLPTTTITELCESGPRVDSDTVRASRLEEMAFKAALRSYRPMFMLEVKDAKDQAIHKWVWRLAIVLAFCWLIGVERISPKQKDYHPNGYPRDSSTIYFFMVGTVVMLFLSLAQAVVYIIYTFVLHRDMLSSPQQWWQLALISLCFGLWAQKGGSVLEHGFDADAFVTSQDDTKNRARVFESIGILIYASYLLVQHRSGFHPIHFSRGESSICGMELSRVRQHYPWKFYFPAVFCAACYATAWCAVNLYCDIAMTPSMFGGIAYIITHDVDMGSDDCPWLVLLLDIIQVMIILYVCVKRVRMPNPEVDVEEVQPKWFGGIDFAACRSKEKERMPPRSRAQEFDEQDLNNDGYLDEHEIKIGRTITGAERTLRELDTDGDNRVSRREYVAGSTGAGQGFTKLREFKYNFNRMRFLIQAHWLNSTVACFFWLQVYIIVAAVTYPKDLDERLRLGVVGSTGNSFKIIPEIATLGYYLLVSTWIGLETWAFLPVVTTKTKARQVYHEVVNPKPPKHDWWIQSHVSRESDGLVTCTQSRDKLNGKWFTKAGYAFRLHTAMKAYSFARMVDMHTEVWDPFFRIRMRRFVSWLRNHSKGLCTDEDCPVCKTDSGADKQHEEDHEEDTTNAYFDPDAEDDQLFHTFVHQQSETFGCIFELQDHLVVSFRGTKAGANVKTDLCFCQKNKSDTNLGGSGHEGVLNRTDIRASACCEADYGHVPDYKVHSGFHEAFEKIWFCSDEVQYCKPSHVQQAHSSTQDQECTHEYDSGVGMNIILLELIASTGKPVMFVGHSLGGAITSIAIHWLIAQALKAEPHTALSRLLAKRKDCNIKDTKDTRLSLWTFGCPRVGDKAFGKFVTDYVPDVWRIMVESDPVPELPTSTCGMRYKHFGTLILLLAEGAGGLILDPPNNGAKYGIDLFFKLGCTLKRHRMFYYRHCLDQWVRKQSSNPQFFLRFLVPLEWSLCPPVHGEHDCVSHHGHVVRHTQAEAPEAVASSSGCCPCSGQTDSEEEEEEEGDCGRCSEAVHVHVKEEHGRDHSHLCGEQGAVSEHRASYPVSYTHLTLPTKRIV